MFTWWILRARDRDRDILARLRFGHQRPLNRRCPAWLGHQRPVNRGCPRVSKPVSQDIQSICYCLHTGIFRLDTCDLVVAGVQISISPKYLYLYLALKLLTFTCNIYLRVQGSLRIPKKTESKINVMIHKEITDDMYRIGIRKKNNISAFASAIDFNWPRTEEAFGEQWGTV